MVRLAVIGSVFLGWVSSVLADEALPRIVSFDFCADQYVLALADADQIVALSPDAAAVFSYFHDKARPFPTHSGNAEEIAVLKPDLLVRIAGGAFKLQEILVHFAIETADIGFGNSFGDIEAAITRIAGAVGHPERGRALIADMRRRLATLQARAAARSGSANPVGVYLTPSTSSTGSGTFVHQAMEMAGLDNLLALAGYQGWNELPLEMLIANPPDILVTSFFDNMQGHSETWRGSKHAVVRNLAASRPVVDVPSRYWSCTGWFLLDAIELIEREANR